MLTLAHYTSQNNLTAFESAINGHAQIALTTKPDKNGNIKHGSFARAWAFATREARIDGARHAFARYLASGMYRPIVNDLIGVLVPKSAQPFVSSIVPLSGPVSKDALIGLCRAVKAAVDATGKTPKGEKAFFYGLAAQIVAEVDAQNTVIEQ